MKIFSKLKLNLLVLFGYKSKIKPNIQLNKEWAGSSYGGFFILPNLLDKNSVIYSFGIGEDMSFDEELLEKFNCNIFAFDPTPKCIKWISEKNFIHSKFNFYPFGIDNVSGIVEFLLPKNDSFVSGSAILNSNVDSNKKILVKMKNLSDITLDLNHKKIDVLKMDIEGSEYKLIENILMSNIEIKQILIEIHERFFDNGISLTKNLLNILDKNGYKLFGVSPSMEELSFVKIN
jgi:FkbM family methyltransferase